MDTKDKKTKRYQLHVHPLGVTTIELNLFHGVISHEHINSV